MKLIPEKKSEKTLSVENSSNLADFLSSRLSSYLGIDISENQKTRIKKYIEDYPLKAGKKFDYFKTLPVSSVDFKKLINIVTTHETYFFREEKQFEILETEIFPKFKGKKMIIWSAACSSGEEAISLLLLAKECGVDAKVYASDVDDLALKSFKSGVFDLISLRSDGKKYWELVNKYSKKNGRTITFESSFINQFNIFQSNLINDDFPISEKIDLIFLRNVFMYFDEKGRNIVNKKIVSLMNENSFLFYSMNETDCFDTNLHKELKLYKQNKDFISWYLHSSIPPKKKSLTEHVPPFEESSVRTGSSEG